MLISTASFASLVVVCVGVLIFWANPGRMVNRTVCTCSLHVAAWLACWHLTANSSDSGPLWLKWTVSIGAGVPFHLWIVKESIAANSHKFDLTIFRRAWWWFVISAILAVIPFTDSFVPPHSTAEHRIYGWGYYTYVVVDFGLYGYLFYDALRSIRQLTGARRLELQLWLGGGCGVATIILARMALRGVVKDPNFANLQPLLILVFYVGAAYAITAHRIFDARQILLVGLAKIVLVVSVAGVAYLVNRILGVVVSEVIAFLVATVLALWFAAALNAWLDQVWHFYPRASAARQAAFIVAQRETRMENIEKAFWSVLKGWGQAEHALIVSGPKDVLRGGGVEVIGDGVVVNTMHNLRWATPERLARERPTAERLALGDFLAKQGLGVLVIAEGPALTVLVGVGVGAARRPFTYPQVTQLMELASIIEGALERAHFSAKAQHAEQLATVGLLGSSLAHEIRNPLVTIKTFAQLLPKHYQDAAFREKFFRLISDEVGRIDQLTEQLLDLASPRTYTAEVIELHPVLRASLDLVAAKAAHKNVQFLTDFQASPDYAFTDASAAKQVMLNLCINAIQAVELHGNEGRWVRIATRNTAGGIEAAVGDSGPGIAADIRPRLFQPFQTTKSTGFGLGLAICTDILANLNASITVDPPENGRGATFRVTFPCQPLSS